MNGLQTDLRSCRADDGRKTRERVIFLDRDGTLNEEVHYLHRPEDLRILPGVPEALRRFAEAGYRLVVVTNQAGVARGYYGEEDVRALHAYMNERLAAAGAPRIDHFFYCPHHPEYGVGTYRIRCRCRKPGTGMFEMAERFYAVDRPRSWMIGDKLTDIQAGKNYGIHTALVGTGYGAQVHAEETSRQGRAGGELPYELYAARLDELAQIILERDARGFPAQPEAERQTYER